MIIVYIRRLYIIDMNMLDYIRVNTLLNKCLKRISIRIPFVVQKPYVPSSIIILLGPLKSLVLFNDSLCKFFKKKIHCAKRSGK